MCRLNQAPSLLLFDAHVRRPGSIGALPCPRRHWAHIDRLDTFAGHPRGPSRTINEINRVLVLMAASIGILATNPEVWDQTVITGSVVVTRPTSI